MNERDIKLPIVSVAVIAYNQKEYLKECIESVLEQDYPNIEIVIADDASTDGTQEMLKEYDKKYPNKFVLKLAEKNLGITKNSNEAHFSCNGKYIAWMGGDDLMLPGKIEKQVEYMEKHPKCTICYHNLDVFESDTNETLYFFNEKVHYEGGAEVLIKYGTFNGACSNMVRASKNPTNGFNETLPVASDWLFWCEYLLNGGEIHYIDEVLGRYRRHDNNITNKSSSKIKQNELDHLNSCNYLMALSPLHFDDIMHRYATNLVSVRHKLPYHKIMIKSLLLRFNLKAFFALIIYGLTLGVKKF